MKKSNLFCGIAYAAGGLMCLLIALFTEGRLEGILWGSAGALLGPGLVMIGKYFYWSAPRNSGRYEERLEQEYIERSDELKAKIRDRSGRYAYVLGLLVISLSMLAFTILDALEVIPDARMLVLYLGFYLVFQIVAGIVLFNRILKTY